MFGPDKDRFARVEFSTFIADIFAKWRTLEATSERSFSIHVVWVGVIGN